MSKTYIGIDNGVSGSIGIIGGGRTFFFKTPTIFGQDYTKTKKNISRIDSPKLLDMIKCYTELAGGKPFALLERPMVNPSRFQATASALRAMEATLVVLEHLRIGYAFIDSKGWQKVMLPAGIKGAAEQKKASLDVGTRLFPDFINIAEDYDGLLIAEWARRTNY